MRAQDQEHSHVTRLMEDPEHFLRMSEQELYDLDPRALQDVHLTHARKRFHELRPKLSALARLATNINADDITSLEDLVPLCFPHTMYKSYSVRDLEGQRFDRLTKWLGTLTTLDLTKINIENCDSLESWLQRVETQTDMRPLTSSGTSGKISIFPRSSYEEENAFFEMVVRSFDPYGNERGIDLRGGEIPLLFPWPYDEGRHNIPVLFRVLRKKVYGGRRDMIVTLGKGRMSADEMLLAGKLRRAESRGEQLTLTEAEKEIAKVMAERVRNNESRWQTFVEEAVVKQKGKTVLFWAPWFQVYQLATYCKDKGIPIEWSADSVVMSGGGTKGNVFPPGWQEAIAEGLPFKYPSDYKETYSFTECTANSILCAHGKLHPHPWGIPFVINPDTSEPLPRTGTQTGRCAFFDQLPRTYWGGTITGDEVTICWEGGCECGRKGPYFLNNIRRYIETRDGDDKITCAKTPDAYDKLSEFALSLGD